MMKLKQKREVLKGTTRNRTISTRMLNNNTDNTLSFVFISSDNSGTRYDWGKDSYYTEELDIRGATFENLNTFFKDHYRSVDSAIGKILNVRSEGGELIGDVTFGTDEDSQKILSKYREGILTDVSIGYEIREYNVIQGADNEQDIVTVTNFDIFEVSAVGLGFDSGAKKRSKETNLNEDNIMDKELLERLAELEAMSKRNEEQQVELSKLEKMRGEATIKELERLKADNAELKRSTEVRNIAIDFGERGARILKELGDVKITPDEFRAKLLADFATDSKDFISKNDGETRSSMIDAMVDGLAMRVGAEIKEPKEGADKYRHASLIDIAKALLPKDEQIFDRNEIAQRSLVTGDFPLLLQSVGARVLVSEFEAQVGTYKAWMKEVDVPDFRVMQDVTAKMGGGRLDKILENGDYRELSGAEKAESWKIRSFGNKFVLTREMLINDDLGAFTGLIAEFGAMASTTANGIAYDILQSVGDYANYKLADGSGLYVASRNNSATDALTSANLSKGRLAMSKHTSIDGKSRLRITPKYLIVAPNLEVTAKEILGATQKFGADNVAVPNVNQNAYVLVVDPELRDGAWYLLAERKTFKMGFLAGTGRRPVLKTNDTSLARTVFEGVFDLGVMAEDYKGLYRGNAGA